VFLERTGTPPWMSGGKKKINDRGRTADGLWRAGCRLALPTELLSIDRSIGGSSHLVYT